MNGLGRAAQRMVPELERYNINVYMLEYRIEWVIPQGSWEIKLPKHLPAWYYRIMLRRLIKIAKQYEGRL